MSKPHVTILVATMTGTAELCAEEAAAALAGAGIDASIELMDALDASVLDDLDHLAVISSTYGQGDIPDNGQKLFEAIEQAENLSGLKFAVFGLGDRTYAATFCEAARKWDSLFAAKGATRIAPIFEHDASSAVLAEDVAGPWAAGWASQVSAAPA